MTLGDRIAVIREGRLDQVAPPAEVYASPANAFVARFIGAPAMNLLPAGVAGMDAASGVTAGIRPHDVVIGADGPIAARVELVEPRGHDTLVHLRLDDGELAPVVAVVYDSAPAVGTQVSVGFPRDRLHLFSGSGERVQGIPSEND